MRPRAVVRLRCSKVLPPPFQRQWQQRPALLLLLACNTCLAEELVRAEQHTLIVVLRMLVAGRLLAEDQGLVAPCKRYPSQELAGKPVPDGKLVLAGTHTLLGSRALALELEQCELRSEYPILLKSVHAPLLPLALQHALAPWLGLQQQRDHAAFERRYRRRSRIRCFDGTGLPRRRVRRTRFFHRRCRS